MLCICHQPLGAPINNGIKMAHHANGSGPYDGIHFAMYF